MRRPCTPHGDTLPPHPPTLLQESEDAVKALAKEKDLLEREKWELRRQAKEATDHATALRSQLDLKDNRMKELEAELAMVSPSPPCPAFTHPGRWDLCWETGHRAQRILEWSGGRQSRTQEGAGLGVGSVMIGIFFP